MPACTAACDVDAAGCVGLCGQADIAGIPCHVGESGMFRHASPATSRHNGKPKKLQCIRFRLEKPNSQLVALCVFLMDSGPNTNSLGKTQFAISCVMCFPMDSGPNTDSLGKTQFATSCVMCFPMDSGPNTDLLEIPKPNQLKADHIIVDKTNSQLVALCVSYHFLESVLHIAAQAGPPLDSCQCLVYARAVAAVFPFKKFRLSCCSRLLRLVQGSFGLKISVLGLRFPVIRVL